MNYLLPISSFLAVVTGFLLLIINPGVIFSDNKNNNNEKIYCYDCKFFYPSTNKKMEHCYTCKTCICNLDHHCGVVGKCVGKYNMILFILFVISITGYMICFSFILSYLLALLFK